MYSFGKTVIPRSSSHDEDMLFWALMHGKRQLLPAENLRSKQARQRKQEEETSLLWAGDVPEFPVGWETGQAVIDLPGLQTRLPARPQVFSAVPILPRTEVLAKAAVFLRPPTIQQTTAPAPRACFPFFTLQHSGVSGALGCSQKGLRGANQPVLSQLGQPQHFRAHPNSCYFHSISVLVASQLRTTAHQKRFWLPYRIPPALEFYQTFNYQNAKGRYTMCCLAQCSNSSHTDLLDLFTNLLLISTAWGQATANDKCWGSSFLCVKLHRTLMYMP